GRPLGPPFHQTALVPAEHALHPPARHPAGRHAVNTDAEIAERAGERLGHGPQRALTRRIGQRLRARPRADDAVGVDDAGVLTALKERHRMFGDQEYALHVHPEDVIPLLDRDFLEIARRGFDRGAGVVAEHVKPAEGLGDRIHHGYHTRLVGDVALQRQRLGAMFFAGVGGFTRLAAALAVVDHHVVTGLGERDGLGAADAGRRASDESDALTGTHG